MKTRGAVTSRECACSDPRILMRLVDPGPVPPFDASAFATYDNEQDAAPLESELVEDLPGMPSAVGEGEGEVAVDTPPIERPPFRGKGYLRAEAPPETDEIDSELSPDSSRSRSARDAGDAASPIEGKPQNVSAGSSDKAAATSGSTDSQGDEGAKVTDGPSRGRSRRSRRRRRKPGETPDSSSETSTPSGSVSQPHVNSDQATSSSGAASTEAGDPSATSTAPTSAGDKPKSDKPTGRRRRRRSRNRGRGRGESGGDS
ncbi:MAG: hypothetical protein P8J37_06995 [Fuerstiella sp.]|nr:hypothetical protein [Fuerstiella sp.]